MFDNLINIKLGLTIVILGLLVGIGLGIGFGLNEEFFEEYVADGIAAHPQVHDARSQDKIWRYAQRAHFHATGIAAFSVGLLLLIAASSLKQNLKKAAAVFIGLGSLYPLSWWTMFVLAPSIGRDAAHAHPVTELLSYISVSGLLLGLAMLLVNLFMGLLREPDAL